ncbi:cytochrome c biogenesis protein transmembrane region [Caldithrix abyssi DSM 13497]|uniref:Cytochrome c biogenesis protein transmembrane region n=1 Tax=Caldithrix abyssi DSM 13497 TaxID=880073 RepID=H1XXN7_CALAY|nr:thioredoxin family protein [Caldithrix abyssi]APF19250.1 thiol:disulfide interchange protein DsbD [Caldithrix abyssi DSM 13497]EHO43161.1 cytochrome c biogenesis protein transmembrane region [Caldithrix abyssi DSM 13497]
MALTFYRNTFGAKRLFVLAAVIGFLILSMGRLALAQSLFDQPKHVQAQVYSEAAWATPGETIWLAIELTADEEWHFYYKNYGETGKPTEFFFDAPEGVQIGPVQWPYPEVISEEDITTFGYKGTQYFLVPVTLKPTVPAGKSITIKINVDWLECKEVCIPGSEELQITLPVKNEPPEVNEKYTQLFADARFKIPHPLTDWQMSASGDEQFYKIQLTPPEWFKNDIQSMYFIPYDDGIIQYEAKQEFKKKGDSYLIVLKRSQQTESLVDTLKGVILAEPGWRGQDSEKGVEVAVPVSEHLAPLASSGINSIWLAILFSFLGGMILNLMPCVLPVLSIKIMRFIHQAQDEHTKPWQHGLVFTAGVLTAFWALAIALLILKAGGEQLGWGFQLQSPAFLIILSVFMFLLGLSMFGVFEIGTSLTAVGGKTPEKSGFFGSFMDGIIATVVATPCTAPFMGGALGFALTQPAYVSLLIFTFLGLGMAFPFALVTSIPALLKYVPKPGRWMESLKQFMGFLLVATVIWLLWVLSQQVGSLVVILVLFNLLFASIAAWVYGRWGNLAMKERTRYLAWAIALILLVLSNGYVLANYHKYAATPDAMSASKDGIQWQPYSDERLNQLLAEGKPVFIDFTASWCLSCQVNEKVAFSSEEVQNKFKELGVVALKADWTSRDPEITRALSRFGRQSVPLYLLYSGKAGQKPQILPEVLTPGIVLDALESLY